MEKRLNFMYLFYFRKRDTNLARLSIKISIAYNVHLKDFLGKNILPLAAHAVRGSIMSRQVIGRFERIGLSLMVTLVLRRGLYVR